MSLTRRKLNALQKDEKHGNREYREAAREASSKVAKRMFLSMARDEARHAKMLSKIRMCEKKYK